MMIETLTSAKNPLLKIVRRATTRGALTVEGFCIAEGFHLLDEALKSGCEVFTVMFAEYARESVERMAIALDAESPAYMLPNALFREISTTEASQGVIALVRAPSWTLEQVMQPGALTVVLDGVQEPGNAGAIVRTAEAFGAGGIVFLKGTVSPFNPKCLRASAGSLFRFAFVQNVEDQEFQGAVAKLGLRVIATLPDGPLPVQEADWNGGCAILIGSEGRGVRTELSRDAVKVRIPTSAVESLNASVAAGVVLYEAQRQRSIR